MKKPNVRITVLLTVRRFFETAMTVYAGYAALFLLTAAIPLLILLLSAIRLIPDYNADNLTATILGMLPNVEAIRSMVSELIEDLNSQSTQTVSIAAALTALFSASTGVYAIQKGLKKLDGYDFSNYLVDRLFSVFYTFIFLAILIAMLIFHVLSKPIIQFAYTCFTRIGQAWAAEQIAALIRFFRPFVIGAVILFVLLLYTYVPGRKRKIREQLPGTVFTTLCWVVFSQIFSFYIQRFWLKSHIYGSLTAIILIILWLYVIICVLFMGASLNAALRPITSDSHES